MKYLVTGAAGFIGHHIVARLLREEGEVVALDSLACGDLARLRPMLEHRPKQLEFRQVDMVDQAALLEVFRDHRFDAVLHLAALGSVPRSIADPCATVQNNVLSTAHALWLSLKTGVRKFVHSSSASVYGGVGLDRKDEGYFLEPANPYGVSKLAAEKMVKVFWPVYGLPTISLRYFNVFGPGQTVNGSYPAVIPAWVGALERGEPMPIYGDGEQRRDFTFVENVVEANLLALAAGEECCGDEFNVGCGHLTSVNDLSRMVAGAWGPGATVKHLPARQGDVRCSVASLAKSGAALGYRPLVHVEAGVRQTVEWYRQKPRSAP